MYFVWKSLCSKVAPSRPSNLDSKDGFACQDEKDENEEDEDDEDDEDEDEDVYHDDDEESQ